MVFLGLPHGHSAAIAEQLGDDVTIIDCGADFRLSDAAEWEHYYGSPHAGTWTYGIPELPNQREKIAAANRIAVPGCFHGSHHRAVPVAGVRPGQARFLRRPSRASARARRPPPMLGSEVMGNLKAYNTAGRHRHTAEFR